jgi:hypothetical protein
VRVSAFVGGLRRAPLSVFLPPHLHVRSVSREAHATGSALFLPTPPLPCTLAPSDPRPTLRDPLAPTLAPSVRPDPRPFLALSPLARCLLALTPSQALAHALPPPLTPAFALASILVYVVHTNKRIIVTFVYPVFGIRCSLCCRRSEFFFWFRRLVGIGISHGWL